MAPALLSPLPAPAEERSYFVIPAVGTSKNDGVDVGVIVPYVLADDEQRVTKIIAPMFIHNEFVGSRAAINVFEYPTRGEEYRLIASYTERTERKFLYSYRNLFLPGGRFSLEATVGFFKNGTARLFGIGGQTSPAHGSNYTHPHLRSHITTRPYGRSSSRWFRPERLRTGKIQPGRVPSPP